MRDKKEYMVGEIFRFNEQTFQCVASEIQYNRCKKCAIPHNRCCTVICDKTRRYDVRDVHFIRVTKPEDGMLFRASDGVLYGLIENECIHYMGDSLCTCYEIDQQAFGDILSNNFHWYPVEENKQEKSNMEETKRHLELAVVKVDGDQVTFKIVKQTHRGEKLTPNGNKFLSRSGYAILSDKWPEYKNRDKHLFVCGSNSNDDHILLTVEIENFAKIMEAVNEYNETDGNSYKDEWPKYGDSCYYIAPNGAIEYTIYYASGDVYDYKLFGNLFRTVEEAEAARERVKTILNKK